jgi:hypothetical protein
MCEALGFIPSTSEKNSHKATSTLLWKLRELTKDDFLKINQDGCIYRGVYVCIWIYIPSLSFSFRDKWKTGY